MRLMADKKESLLRVTLRELLANDGWNSRFIYLMVNTAVVLCVIALVAASIWKGIGTNSSQAIVLDAFIYLVGVLLAGGATGAAGRWLTNKKSTRIPAMESTETTTVTEKVKKTK